ncbi:MAG: hypothetical protein ACOC4C_00045 [Fibrobacterota bacterium]
MTVKTALTFVLLLCFIALLGCASRVKVSRYSYEKQLLVHADSLFDAGSYEYAKLKYMKIRDEYSNTAIGARAQFHLGYLNVYFDNPFADYAAALREFKLYQSWYPEGERIESANNWIRVLTVLKDFDKQYHGKQNKLDELQIHQDSIHQNYEELQNAFVHCETRNDTLKSRIRTLEGLVQELEGLIEEIDQLR